MANKEKITENELAAEIMAVELIAEASIQGVNITLTQARAGVWLGFLALSDVLEAKGALSNKATELRSKSLKVLV